MARANKNETVFPFEVGPAGTPRTPLLNRLTSFVARAKTPETVLDGLDEFASQLLPIHVLAIARLPKRTSDWPSVELGKDVFLHSSVPMDWWREYSARVAHAYDPSAMMAKTGLTACTLTEMMRELEPIGTDRWPFELALKYSIRDALTCSVGQRWLVAYWSRQTLCGVLTEPVRLLLFAAGGLAASQLERLIGDDPRRFGDMPRVTARELAVLRLVSQGMGSNEISARLGIGEETVRSHLKKAQLKLGARNRAHAAAEAIRRQLIP